MWRLLVLQREGAGEEEAGSRGGPTGNRGKPLRLESLFFTKLLEVSIGRDFEALKRVK